MYCSVIVCVSEIENKKTKKESLIYVISMEFLAVSRRLSSPRKVPSGEERGETAVFSG